MITNPTAPSYADWINQGANTFWEFWNGQDSRNHIMYGDISAWFFKNLAGINLDTQITNHEAFKHFILRPRLLSELTQIFALYESIRGTINSDWMIEENDFKWSVHVPANTTATIYVPAISAQVVTESDQPAAKADGVTFDKFENGYAVYTIQSGRYLFKSQLPESQ